MTLPIKMIDLPEGYDKRVTTSEGGDVRCPHHFIEDPDSNEEIKKYVCANCGMVRTYGRKSDRDIFRSGFTLPDKVCIVGSGPNGNGHLSRIPDDYYIIAVNKAVSINGLKADAWMCMDITLVDKPWWSHVYFAYKAARMLGEPIVSIFGEELDTQWEADYTFRSGRAMNWNNYEPNENELRVAATISGQALQLCFHKGVKHVRLFGIDMCDGKYFDGTTSDVHGDGPWNCVNRFSSLVKFCINNGMDVKTLTITEIEVDTDD